MAWTVTQYRTSNPGVNFRIFDVNSTQEGDTTTTFSHGCPWTPDEWSIVSKDGSTCAYEGNWRATVGPTLVTVIKTPPADAEVTTGTCRLTLERHTPRP